MKYFIGVLLTGFSTFCFSSCKPESKLGSSQLITADLIESMKGNEVALLSEFVDDAEMVVLDGQGKWFLPSGVVYPKYYENYTVILDRRNKNICVFGKDGQFKFVLNKPGQGPGEFYSPTDAGMDYLEKKVFVFESNRRLIHWYDLNGLWIESINLPTRLKNVHTLPEGDFLYQNDQLSNDDLDSCRMMLANKSGTVERCIWDNGLKNRNTASFQDACWLMPNIDGGHYYRDLYLGDTIYSLDSHYNLSPTLVMDAGKYRLPAEIALDMNKRHLFKNYLRKHTYYSVPDGFLIAGNMEDKVYFHVDKNNGEVISFRDIKDDITGLGSFPNEVSVNGQYLVRSIRIQYYLDNPDGMFKSKEIKSPEIQDKIKKVVQDGNDQIDFVLLFYKIKL